MTTVENSRKIEQLYQLITSKYNWTISSRCRRKYKQLSKYRTTFVSLESGKESKKLASICYQYVYNLSWFVFICSKQLKYRTNDQSKLKTYHTSFTGDKFCYDICTHLKHMKCFYLNILAWVLEILKRNNKKVDNTVILTGIMQITQ
jgi:hypothetical protein